MDSDDEVPELIEGVDVAVDAKSSKRVPLTIICGFLGAGKSTLLKRILSENHGFRIAVIMNEFGDTADIEAKRINVSSPDDPTAQQSEEILELANGCLCCSIKDAGIAAIEKLMTKKGSFDHILLETTGLADPAPIASMLWRNEEYTRGLSENIVLDGVICVVDAMFGAKQLADDSTGDEIGESLRQITGSDIIILNKVDLAPHQEIASLEESIRDLNPAAPIFKTERANVPIKDIIGINAYSTGPRSFTLVPLNIHEHSECDDHDHDHKHKHEKSPTHYELRGISSLQVICPILTPKQLDSLDVWIRTVLWDGTLPGQEQGDLQILRCKGIFVTEDGQQHVLQGVRSMYEISKVSTDTIGVPDAGKLVFIGKGLTDTVRESLTSILFSR